MKYLKMYELLFLKIDAVKLIDVLQKIIKLYELLIYLISRRL
jgi:hypothetical protein